MTQEELKKIAEESWEECDGCTETDKQMYVNGFVRAAFRYGNFVRFSTFEDSPYCKVCSACGVEGCCSPMACKQSPDGDYCQSYLNDLKMGYVMNQFFENEIMDQMPLDLKEKYNAEWDKAYDQIYNDKES